MKYRRYGAYKESGVEWLGEVPAHWEVKRLRMLAEINPSKSEVAALPSTTEVTFLPMELISEQGLLNLSQCKPIEAVYQGFTYFRDNDVICAKITPCFENGKGALARGLTNGIAFGTTELHVLRAYEGYSPAFLWWVTRGDHFRTFGALEMKGAAGQQRVPQSFVENFPQPVPPLDEQLEIAAFLDHETAQIDALIAKQERLIAVLQEKRQALISHAVTKGLNPQAPMKESGVEWLGEVPAHWEVLPLRRLLVSIEQGQTLDSEGRLAEPGEWGVLKSGCVNGGKFRSDEHKALSASATFDEKHEVKRGDILMSRASGSIELVGSVALIEEIQPRLLLSDKTFRLVPSATVLPEFLVGQLNARHVRRQIEVLSNGAEGLPNNITKAAINSLIVTLPSAGEQIDIVEHLRRGFAEIDRGALQASAMIDLLRERRAAVISATVTGKIDVRSEAFATVSSG